jgi:hypothetical protein
MRAGNGNCFQRHDGFIDDIAFSLPSHPRLILAIDSIWLPEKTLARPEEDGDIPRLSLPLFSAKLCRYSLTHAYVSRPGSGHPCKCNCGSTARASIGGSGIIC